MPVSIVWLKRDLRLHDHAALKAAADSGHPLLMLYIFEPEMESDPHLSLRHFRFIYQSLSDLNQQQPEMALTVQREDIIDCLERLHKKYRIAGLYSHQETGLNYTFQRDIRVGNWCSEKQITWHEFPTGAVQRGLINRKNWQKHWQQTMRSRAVNTDLARVQWLRELPPDASLPVDWQQFDENFQAGGEQVAWAVLNDFYAGRGQYYYRKLSSPLTAEHACSRLSPYLAWGNISLRQVYHTVLRSWSRNGWRRSLQAFSSRLHWHCHFIQKFESDCRIEFENLNSGYNNMPLTAEEQVKPLLDAWKSGQTGFPMVDACMRCLQHTGYINFRMRAMLVSFLTHHLAIDWRYGVKHLAQLFLDFEPGIHYSQFQMQAGITGINTVRVYNPVKQGQEKDPDGVFISRWCPELSHLPVALIHQPWLLTPMEEQLYDFKPGSHYPTPIIDLEVSARKARERLWSWRKKAEVKANKEEILSRHVASKTQSAQ
ncbi:DNA photolyase family protein [Idiomarina seosinensis]|uniref:FAD-binding domain-containing protein n=1 Tax=Idiomarina seosinensis TaxID=281739 RepID=UPI00384E5FD3